MKKMFLAMAAMAALCLFSACGDETSSDPTRGELCQGGLSFDCLADGTWKLDGMTEFTEIAGDTFVTINGEHNFKASPATLHFEANGKFTFTYPPESFMHTSCYEAKTYGTWSVSGKVLTLKPTTGNTCIDKKNPYHGNWIKEVSVTKNGGNIELDLKGIFFMNAEMENASDTEKATMSEIYYISAQ